MSGINGFVGRRNFLKLVGIGSAGVAASGLIWHEEEVVAQQPITLVIGKTVPKLASSATCSAIHIYNLI